MNENTERWLKFARDDLRAARELLKPRLYNLCCFHAQQCAEKAFKADIVSEGVAPPKLHSLNELQQRANVSLEPGLVEKLHDLDAFYIPARYPDALPGMKAEGLPGKDEAEVSIKTADAVLKAVVDKHRFNK